MSVNSANFPDGTWDGLSPNDDRASRLVDHTPEYEDWDQIVAEVISTQEYTPRTFVVVGDDTINSATPASIADLEFSLGKGSYAFDLTIFAIDSQAAEGLLFDFGGGDCTVGTFRAHGLIHSASALEKSLQTSDRGTDIADASLTGDSVLRVSGYLTVTGAGGFGPRFGQNSHTSGTATVYEGSHMTVRKLNV